MGIHVYLEVTRLFSDKSILEGSFEKWSETFRVASARGTNSISDFIFSHFPGEQGDMEEEVNLTLDQVTRITKAYPDDEAFARAQTWLTEEEPSVMKYATYRVSY